MKFVFAAAAVAFWAGSAWGQSHPMWVSQNATMLRQGPFPTSHALLKLSARALVVVSDAPTVLSKKPALAGKWARVTFAPEMAGGTGWVGWVETRCLTSKPDTITAKPLMEAFRLPDGSQWSPRGHRSKGGRTHPAAPH